MSTADGPPPVGALRWRARRGVRELDLLLARFLEETYPDLSPEVQSRFAALLESSDADLLDWLTGRRPGPAAFRDVLAALRARS